MNDSILHRRKGLTQKRLFINFFINQLQNWI